MADPTRMELVVVAIPRDDDEVWKVSSEDVPHMTLLYLGEVDWTQEQVDRAAAFVSHASSQLSRFWMTVDRRGKLGDKDADVLFFDKSWSFKDLESFRSNLLANRELNDAYLQAFQHPEWTPHLTLGYPETPAKPLTRDYPINGVEFDKIALWTGISSGPTFLLKSFKDADLEVSMSQAQLGADFLEHYGVKGMHWGTRKDRKWGENIYTTRSAVKVHNEMAHRMNNGVIDKHNDDPRWKGKNLRTNPKLEALYYKEFAKLQDKVYKEAVTAVHGVSPSGEHKAVYVNDSQGARIEIRPNRAVRHAEEDTSPDLVIRLKLDALGQVTEVNTAKGALEHSAEEFLEHYGVKGMKWGQHIKRKSGDTGPQEVTTQHKGRRLVAKGGGKHTPHEDAINAAISKQIANKSGTHSLSNKDLQAAVNRMNLEKQFNQLNPRKGPVAKGQAFIKTLLGVGKTANEVIAFTNSPAGQQIKTQFANRS